jgi:hypothetical protein
MSHAARAALEELALRGDVEVTISAAGFAVLRDFLIASLFQLAVVGKLVWTVTAPLRQMPN